MFAQVGESNRPTFRPGLEGGSSDDEDSIGHRGPSLSGMEHRRSAEGQVINLPVAGKISQQFDVIYILDNPDFTVFMSV